MRGRRGHSSSLTPAEVSQKQTRMALRKQMIKDVSDIPSGSQQEDEALDDRDDNDELSLSILSPSSSREKRKKERENKSKPKEMTEEEMMDLALRLSEQEASVTALRLQKEEEAMMKAIHESMASQTQPCPPSQSQSLLTDAEASLRICSRRKLLYSNGKPVSVVDQGASEVGCTPETDLNTGAKGTGDESNNRNKKRKRKEGSPLLEMPDLSQTQNIYSQASPCSSESLDLVLDSTQSSESTQIDDCQLRKSPVFPSTGCRAEVHVPRLSQDLLQTCRTSGFVLLSQDSWTSPRKSSPAQPKSPTFPKSPKRSGNLTLSKSTAFPKSPVSSETDHGDDGETEPSPEYFKSPVFGRNTQHEKSPSACKPQVNVCNSGFMFSSQESLTSSVRSASCRPKSPVFPKSPGLPQNLPPPESAICKSPVFSETDGGQTEQSHGCCTSPVLGRTGRPQKVHLDVQNHSASPSAAELRCSGTEGISGATGDQSLRQDSKADHNQDVKLNESDEAEEVKEISKDRDSAEVELTSDMTLVWSDEEEDDTPVGSHSPIFPEERPVHQADSKAASLNHVTAASQGTTRSNCRPSSSSTSTAPTEREKRPISSQGTVSRPSASHGEPVDEPTVHYYWGVPFCPRGLDPDNYTQVILAQMEVYEKSLKQAQRCLLRKAEWGEGILPQPEKCPSPESPAESPQELFPRRRGLRLRTKKLSDTADSPSVEVEEEEDKRDEEEGKERENKGEEQENEGEGVEVDNDDCEVCPETQLSDNDDDRTQDLMIDTVTRTELQPKSPALPEVEMILQNDSPDRDEQQKQQQRQRQEEDEEEMEVEVEVEVDAPVDRKTKGNIPVVSSDGGGPTTRKEEVEEDMGDLDVEEIKEQRLQRSTSPELEPAAASQSSETNVDCPICQGSFPVTEIEMHAAYCDGEVAVVHERRPKADCFPVSLKPRRKRTKRAEVTADETDTSNTSMNPEKCFICQKAVPLRDYSRHTELCIQRQSSKTAAKGNLLSALEQTDSRHSEAGPSGSSLQPGDVIDLRDDDEEDEEEGGVSAIRISNSPIRSFTPISEATGCLIDFKKQQRTKKLTQRRR
ncbi:BRCA1-A complex subunit RAP80 isoform X2 [Morone saxatilis]|uniref:BRCA1-A complex subunit RAP80 isoform X2 n=1 Tax=Morone saxatilis TaxID=34816 RepID=UPI0015E236EE|nr:BRCA1-A complex subunit RAP80 isoform X2 [Morone saxatilis]XP_035522433.1 BRCA1-A complex subunit RAP80 isoform X2 [Morone saxatilis]